VYVIDETRGSVWFVTGSQHLYGEETLRQVHEHSRKLAEALNDSPAIPVAIVDREPLTDADAIRRVLAEASSDDECVGVIAWMHTFSPARMWIGGLKALRKPLLHLHTQFDRELPWGQIDMDYMNLNQSAHGDREFAYIETRMGVSRKTVVGHWSDRLVQERIGIWIRAACGWQEAQRLRIARFGDNMRDVAVTEGDKVGAQITLGATVNGYGVDGLSDAVEHARDAAVDELLERYDDEYDLASELRPDGARRESLVQAAQIEVGLRSVLLDGGFGAFTDTFEDLGRLRQLPGIAVQRLMAEGYGFGGEGDWKTALLLRVLKVMASGLSGGTSFMEDYVYHLGPGPAKVLGAHMLEICPSIAAARPSCEIHPLSIGGRDDPVRLVFTAPPGQAVMICLVDVGARLRLVANQVDVVPPDEELPRLPVARAVWEPRPELSTAAEAWLMAGGSHHSVFTMALKMEALRDLADIAGIELLVIDEDTTIPQFANELRWNRAYHHLARGL
jgi:L-arabinose isomerase